MNPNPCPLCESVATEFYTYAMNRDYYRCKTCQLIFVPKIFLLKKSEEKKRYDFHDNRIDDPAYIAFLSQLFQPVVDRIKANSMGLDFGSGPEPVLAQLFEKKGFKMNIFDPLYANNPEIFTKKFDFITLSEVAEHLYHPLQEFNRLLSLLNPKGYLTMMTLRTDSVKDFNNWHYQKDETHVCFYAKKTMEYIAEIQRLSLEFLSDRVVIFQKI